MDDPFPQSTVGLHSTILKELKRNKKYNYKL